MSATFVLATGNKGKLNEIRQILDGTGLHVEPQSSFNFEPAEETGSSFLENALLKARHAATETGLPAIADDSGLVVDALDGAPGVYTARYAGVGASDRDNIEKLLRALQGVEGRGAAFHCVTVVAWPQDAREPLIAEGVWRGTIATRAHGDGGFGYDPVFCDPELGKCAAEMTPEDKNARSHRGQAFRALGAMLSQ